MTTRFQKSIIAAMGGLFLAGGLAGAASAKTIYLKPGYAKPGYVKPFYPKPYYPKPYHPGYVGVGLGLGALAVGAAAASAASGAVYADEECYIVRRRVVDAYGNVFIRRVPVCE